MSYEVFDEHLSPFEGLLGLIKFFDLGKFRKRYTAIIRKFDQH